MNFKDKYNALLKEAMDKIHSSVMSGEAETFSDCGSIFNMFTLMLPEFNFNSVEDADRYIARPKGITLSIRDDGETLIWLVDDTGYQALEESFSPDLIFSLADHLSK